MESKAIKTNEEIKSKLNVLGQNEKIATNAAGINEEIQMESKVVEPYEKCHIELKADSTCKETIMTQLESTDVMFQEEEAQVESTTAKTNDPVLTLFKFIIFPVYCYSLCQLVVSYRNLDNPKYIYGLIFNLKTVPRWKLFPFAIFECYLSFTAASIMMFYIIIIIVHVKSTKWCLERLM